MEAMNITPDSVFQGEVIWIHPGWVHRTHCSQDQCSCPYMRNWPTSVLDHEGNNSCTIYSQSGGEIESATVQWGVFSFVYLFNKMIDTSYKTQVPHSRSGNQPQLLHCTMCRNNSWNSLFKRHGFLLNEQGLQTTEFLLSRVTGKVVYIFPESSSYSTDFWEQISDWHPTGWFLQRSCKWSSNSDCCGASNQQSDMPVIRFQLTQIPF